MTMAALLSNEELVSLFRTFDRDQNDRLNSIEFMDLVTCLCTVRDGAAPSETKANAMAAKVTS